MKILLLYDRYLAKDSRTRLYFVLKLESYSNLVIYGPGEKSNLSPLSYNPSITMKDVITELQPDVILLLFYKPGCYDWLPFDFSSIDIPSAIIEEDHYDGNEPQDHKVLNWYRDMNFSVIIRRHFYPDKFSFQSVWLPFSANEAEFTKVDGPRISRIGFAGSDSIEQVYYDIRRKAISILKEADLLALEYGGIWDRYKEYLQQYVGCLSCAGGILHTPLAKTFEIPLCGTALLTNKMEEKELFWGKDQCYFEYKDDCSDIIDVARSILLDRDKTNEVVANALVQVTKRHTDSKRIEELYNILYSLYNGTEVPRIWGQ